MKTLEKVNIVPYNRKIYVPQSLQVHELYWYPFGHKHQGCRSFTEALLQLFYFKLLICQIRAILKHLNMCQQFKATLDAMDIFWQEYLRKTIHRSWFI